MTTQPSPRGSVTRSSSVFGAEKKSAIQEYHDEKEKGNLFSFLKEFVKDTSGATIKLTEEHISKATAYTDDKYMWITRHELMILAHGYKYDEGKKYAEKMLKGAKSKGCPGKEKYRRGRGRDGGGVRVTITDEVSRHQIK